jgi:hypothetical protein
MQNRCTQPDLEHNRHYDNASFEMAFSYPFSRVDTMIRPALHSSQHLQ